MSNMSDIGHNSGNSYSSSQFYKYRKRSRSSSNSHYSDNSSISNSHSSTSSRKHKKQKTNSHKVHNHKKHKKHKYKDKHKKISKKEHKKSKSHGVVTSSWGKYGQIHESDMWKKRQEFQLWLLEVKNRNLEELPNWEEKQLFKDYMEDFNTATFPHKKYYDLQKWELKMANKQSRKIDHLPERTNFNDEAIRLQEIKKLRDIRAMDTLKQEFSNIKDDSEKISAMKNQKLLRQRMDLLFKMGRLAEAQKIQDILRPET